MRKEYDFGQASRGAVVPVAKGKTRITIRVDEEVVEWFKQQVHAAGGGNYQTLFNTALREYIQRISGGDPAARDPRGTRDCMKARLTP